MPLSSQTLDEIGAELKAVLGERALDITQNHGLMIIRVPPEQRAETLAMLKTFGCTYYSFCCGVDWPEQDKMEVFDHVEDLARNLHVTVKCEVPRSNPRVETATAVYGGADWHERETWELFGIVFVGHPGLRRLLLADWQEGFPMRKDEVLRARVEKPWPGEFFSG